MRVTVLVIIYRGSELITVHENDERASKALLDFVDERWESHFAEAGLPAAATADERISLFFAAEGDLYTFGSADVSELDARVDSFIGEGAPPRSLR